jgi:Zn-dependent protease
VATFHFLALFCCVLLHELGHSLMAKRYGVKVHDILLWPLGGVARIERIPDSTRIELAIALAGPAVNFALLCVIVPLALLVGPDPFTIDPEAEFLPFLQWLLLVNLAMGVFNLLPAFPMDGGRVLRALLASRIDPLRATCIAVGIGRFLSLFAIVIGLSNPDWFSLVIVGAFVWIASGIEMRNTLRRARLLQLLRSAT